MSNSHIIEFKRIRPHDPINQITESIKTKGYQFISTAGHGYLIVPKTDKNAHIAKSIVEYGYIGELAYYLEEDCEAWEFLDQI